MTSPPTPSRKGFGYAPVPILLPSTLLLYGSTVLFMASLMGHVASINRLLAQAQAGLFFESQSESDSDGAYTDTALDAFEADVLRHSWMMTAALATNVRLRRVCLGLFVICGRELSRRESRLTKPRCRPCLAARRGQHRVVARVRGVAAEPRRVLSRTPAHHARLRYVSGHQL